jgi:hypothetical protein
MKCLRCKGFMVYEKYHNPQEAVWGLKCLMCGDVIDPIILHNRKLINMDQWMLSTKVKRSKAMLHP